MEQFSIKSENAWLVIPLGIMFVCTVALFAFIFGAHLAPPVVNIYLVGSDLLEVTSPSDDSSDESKPKIIQAIWQPEKEETVWRDVIYKICNESDGSDREIIREIGAYLTASRQRYKEKFSNQEESGKASAYARVGRIKAMKELGLEHLVIEIKTKSQYTRR